jgi:hypothetical protein
VRHLLAVAAVVGVALGLLATCCPAYQENPPYLLHRPTIDAGDERG